MVICSICRNETASFKIDETGLKCYMCIDKEKENNIVKSNNCK